MLGMVVFAWSVLLHGMTLYADAVKDGWELTVDDVKKALTGPQPEQDAIPVLVEEDDNICQYEEDQESM